MKLKLKRLREIDVFLIAIIAAYAFDIGDAKYIMAAVFIFFALTFNLLENENRRTKRHFIKEFKWFLMGILSLLLITVILQLQNGFASYAVNEAIYFLTPLLVVLTYTRHSSNEDVERMLYNAFYVVAVVFLVKYIPRMTVENLKNISFTKSQSAFESELAFVFLIFEIIFIHFKDKKRAIVAFVLCFLSFKRLCLVAAILFFVLGSIMEKDKKVSKTSVIITSLVFIILPVATCYLVESNEIISNIERKLGESLNILTNDRFSRIEIVLKSDEIKHGIGSTTTYLTERLNRMYNANIEQRNLHNDLVRIYVECGIWGTIAYTVTSFVAASNNRMVFILMAYLFLENYVNHLLGAGTVLIWILFYLFVAVANISNPNDLQKRKQKLVTRIK